MGKILHFNVLKTLTKDKQISWQKSKSAFFNNRKTKKEIPEALLSKYKNIGELIALKLAEDKCENCNRTEEELKKEIPRGSPQKRALTIHHMIGRENRNMCSYGKYFFQRNYFQNLVVLCQKCHNIVELRKRTGMHQIEEIIEREEKQAKNPLD